MSKLSRWAKIKRNIRKAPLSFYVVLSLAMVVLYYLVERILTAFGLPPIAPEVTVGWFSVWGGEILTACMIKIFKLREDNNGSNN